MYVLYRQSSNHLVANCIAMYVTMNVMVTRRVNDKSATSHKHGIDLYI